MASAGFDTEHRNPEKNRPQGLIGQIVLYTLDKLSYNDSRTALEPDMPRTCQTYDLIGKTFGKWAVVSRSDRPGNKSYWNCRCACGTTKVMIGYALVKGQSISCGCVPNPPLMVGSPSRSRHPLYMTWAAMKSRCCSPTNPSYKYYGALGVSVCSRWMLGENGMSGLQCFAADMGSPPSPTHTIDRWPDNTGPYRPDNCRWATKLQQTQNRRHRAHSRAA